MGAWPAMTAVLYRLAQFCIRRRIFVLVLWLVVSAVLVVVSQKLGDRTNDNLSLPGTDSQQATDTLAKSFPDQSHGTSPIVLESSPMPSTPMPSTRPLPTWPRPRTSRQWSIR
jgi:uncharacterized membrane protein YdfJ with MMPL/SSD domain